MTTEGREVLSALIDREAVDPDVLAWLLEDREARALLVDFVRLREAVAADEDDPAQASIEAAALRTQRGWAGWWRAAAAALLLTGGAGGGFWLGERLAEDGPPDPARIVEFKPGVDWQIVP